MEVFTCKQICLKFLSSHKAENFEDVVANLLHSYDALGCKMSFKMHFLDHIKKIFHENLGDVSDEHSKRFHLDVAIIEKRFKEKCFVGMLADYYWSVKRLLNCCINNQDVDCRTFLCCFTVSNSIHFCIFNIVNLSLFVIIFAKKFVIVLYNML